MDNQSCWLDHPIGGWTIAERMNVPAPDTIAMLPASKDDPAESPAVEPLDGSGRVSPLGTLDDY
jgi:hypothetical protein